MSDGLRFDALSLRVRGKESRESVELFAGLDLSIEDGECVAITGPSGLGKSSLLRAILGALPATFETSGAIHFSAVDATRARGRSLRRLRSETVLIPQNPFTAFSPHLNVWQQSRKVLRSGRSIAANDLREQLVAALQSLGFDDPERILTALPSQLSGGQLQRVLIARAIVRQPTLILADEPTSALDSASRQLVIESFAVLRRALQPIMLVVTHDRHDFAALTTRTIALDEYAPTSGGGRESTVDPEPVDPVTKDAVTSDEAAKASVPREAPAGTALIADAIVKRFGPGETVLAGVDLRVDAGTVVGLVGPSGTGKSTLARILCGLEPFDSGSVTLGGVGFTASDRLRNLDRSRVGFYVHQDARSCVDPRSRVSAVLSEAARRGAKLRGEPGPSRLAVPETMRLVNLDPSLGRRRAVELSGGQLQRVSIARALLFGASLTVLDESLSGLDDRNRAVVLGALRSFAREEGRTFLVITHREQEISSFLDDTIHLSPHSESGVDAAERAIRA